MSNRLTELHVVVYGNQAVRQTLSNLRTVNSLSPFYVSRFTINPLCGGVLVTRDFKQAREEQEVAAFQAYLAGLCDGPVIDEALSWISAEHQEATLKARDAISEIGKKFGDAFTIGVDMANGNDFTGGVSKETP